MADLLDEAGIGVSENIGSGVRELGGDLLDEIGIREKSPDMLSPQLSEQEITEERQAILDRINSDVGALESFFISAGRGLTTVGRGLGLADKEDPRTTEAFERLEEDRPYTTTTGEVVGQAAPFLLPGTAVTAIPNTVGRTIAASLVGAGEGAAISSGEGQSDEEIARSAGVGGVVAGSFEALFPVVGRLSRKIYERVTGTPPQGAILTRTGEPTPEFQEVLDRAGVDFNDVWQDGREIIANQGIGANPEQVARQARFEQQGIPATRGDITQDFADQAAESRLISMAGAESGEPLRQMRLEQSEAIKGKISDLVDSLGVPDDAGAQIKEALTSRRSLLSSEKRQLYKEATEASREVGSLPLATDSIADAIPSRADLEDLSITAPDAVAQFKLAMGRFGIDDSDDIAALLEKRGLEASPLTVENFERLRKTLNAIDRADPTGASKVMTGPVLKALDDEADLVADVLQNRGITDPKITDTLREARKRVRTIKTEFSPESITGRFVNMKRDGVTPVVEASKVVNELMRPGAPVEALKRTMASLTKSGDKGKKAIGDLQASVIMRALDDALKAPSRKTSGVETFGGNQFAKSLEKFGDDKLGVLFAGNKQALKNLQALKQTAKDITPTAASTPKGSAPVILDLMKKAGRLPGIAAVVEVAGFIAKAGADDRAVARALNARPQVKATIGAIERDFPALASALGIAGYVGFDSPEEQ